MEIKYFTSDGIEFLDKEAAEAHEKEIKSTAEQKEAECKELQKRKEELGQKTHALILDVIAWEDKYGEEFDFMDDLEEDKKAKHKSAHSSEDFKTGADILFKLLTGF